MLQQVKGHELQQFLLFIHYLSDYAIKLIYLLSHKGLFFFLNSELWIKEFLLVFSPSDVFLSFLLA